MKELAGEKSLRAYSSACPGRQMERASVDHGSSASGIHLDVYAAKNPKQEAFELFSQMLIEIKHEAIRIIS